ncbi:hypothetical protein KC338_g67 [Hortaea werneckii]|nr:hypothetical protein KC338_g67 [Hortaea werneckii]
MVSLRLATSIISATNLQCTIRSSRKTSSTAVSGHSSSTSRSLSPMIFRARWERMIGSSTPSLASPSLEKLENPSQLWPW